MTNANVMEYKGYIGTVEFSAENNILFGKVIGINGLVSYEGESVSQLRADFEESVDDYIEMCTEKGIEPQKCYKGSLSVRISPELHRTLAVFATSHDMSLNATVEQAIQKFVSGY